MDRDYWRDHDQRLQPIFEAAALGCDGTRLFCCYTRRAIDTGICKWHTAPHRRSCAIHMHKSLLDSYALVRDVILTRSVARRQLRDSLDQEEYDEEEWGLAESTAAAAEVMA